MKGQSSRGRVFDWFESLELESVNFICFDHGF
jgi:hypothetical protein